MISVTAPLIFFIEPIPNYLFDLLRFLALGHVSSAIQDIHVPKTASYVPSISNLSPSRHPQLHHNEISQHFILVPAKDRSVNQLGPTGGLASERCR